LIGATALDDVETTESVALADSVEVTASSGGLLRSIFRILASAEAIPDDEVAPEADEDGNDDDSSSDIPKRDFDESANML
jgi:hypothetical protein